MIAPRELDTFTQISTGLGFMSAMKAAFTKSTYWQYYPEGSSGYQSRYLVRGVKPPYQPGEEAYRALRLDLSKGNNPGTAVRPVNIKPWEPIRGPRPVEGGTGTEYYRGWRWPKR